MKVAQFESPINVAKHKYIHTYAHTHTVSHKLTHTLDAVLGSNTQQSRPQDTPLYTLHNISIQNFQNVDV